MEVAFSGINIYSKKPEAVFEFYKKLGFRVLEEVAPDDKWYGSTLALQDGDNAPIDVYKRQGQDSHMAIDYEKLLRLGTDGVRAQILAYKARLNPVDVPDDIAKETFYDECLIMLSAEMCIRDRFPACWPRTPAATISTAMAPPRIISSLARSPRRSATCTARSRCVRNRTCCPAPIAMPRKFMALCTRPRGIRLSLIHI